MPPELEKCTIISILKARSPEKELTSFRPISLTSCISKTLEKMIATRLKHLAEFRGWFNSQQAGFRKGHGCEDQIIRIIQAVENGFQTYPMKRSVIALLDFSKTFVTVWRERLLLDMVDLWWVLDPICCCCFFLMILLALTSRSAEERTLRQR